MNIFEHNFNETELWGQWASSVARIRHITSLLTIEMSPEEAVGQADLDFKIRSSGFEIRGSTPEAKIESFERYSNDQTLKRMWGSSKARQRHMSSLLANGFSPEVANRQADADFNDYSQELAKRELSPEAKIEAFEEYFELVFDYSSWEQGKVEIWPQFLQRGEQLEVPDPLEAIGRRDPDRLWRHLCECAELTPQQVIGRFDQTINSKDEPRAVEAILFALRERFKLTGVSDAVIEVALWGFRACVGLT
jgi:hypothetical protein